MGTWSTTNAGKETCPKCGSVYEVTIFKAPCRDSDYFNCEVCGFEMNRWNDTDIPSYTLVEQSKQSEQNL